MADERATESDERIESAAARETIERLFRQHNESLVRFLRARGVSSQQEARDVAQEAYVKVLGLGDASTVSFVRSYLFTTAANIAINRRIIRNRRQELDELVFFDEAQGRSPEEGFAARQELERIVRALREMPAEVAQAFTLVKFEEMEPEQVAKIMGIRSQRVRRFVARAMAHIYRVTR